MDSTFKKRALRIVFMGTPDFAVAGLSSLMDHGHQVVGVVTAPDKPAGRGRKLTQSAVKRFAITKDLPVLQPINLKDEAFLHALAALGANLFVVVAFRMLPRVVWEMPEFGTFNLHASLLPQYRGAAPINWAIINGEMKTGVTTFFIDEQIDTGAIILQKETPISETDTAGSLHDRLMILGADAILETVSAIANGNINTLDQPSIDDLKKAPKIFKEDCQIDWSLPMNMISAFIRGLSPYPTAWTTFYNGGDKAILKVFEAISVPETHNFPVGKIFATKEQMNIACKNGFIRPLVAQLPGKRKMAIKDILNGLSIESDAYVG